MGFQDIQEVQCTGDTLSTNVDILSMVLYRESDDRVIAYANIGKGECSTSQTLVACEIYASDSRKSKLKALIVDLTEGQSRTFGCNVSTIASGGRLKTLSWVIAVHRASKYLAGMGWGEG